MANDLNQTLRALPSVDELLRSETAISLVARTSRKQLTALARMAIANVRARLFTSEIAPNDANAAIEAELSKLAELSFISPLRRVINASGVVIHTNLGRAPLSLSARNALAEAAGNTTLEYDLKTGTRGVRAPLAEQLICEITGAEAAIVVNNCAAAAFFVLKSFASGGEVIVSRGELVEIGGDFRVPDILAESGAAMCEIGTTNRTRLADYATAINEETRMIMRVHPSNYRIVGFTEQPSISELAALAHERGLILFEDIGSGALVDLSPHGVDEPVVAASIAAGVDVVAFSGDKLLGGPQAGIVAGRSEIIERLRSHPLFRALRVGKSVAATLEATLQSYVDGAFQEIPVLRMLTMTRDAIFERARSLVAQLSDKLTARGFVVELVEGFSAVGGGAAPTSQLATCLIAVTHANLTASAIETSLRSSEPAVIARIEDERVLIDLRTVPIEDEQFVISALRDLEDKITDNTSV